MTKHVNRGRCPKCQEILNAFPGFHAGMRKWFEDLQVAHPETHISCAGRGEAAQEADFQARTSNAHWKQSSHNWNAALDFFELLTPGNIYDIPWFDRVIEPAVASAETTHGVELSWYGRPHAPFHELPHVELANWKELATAGELVLVA